MGYPMSLLTISCTNCGRVYPLDQTPFKCATCGGVFDILEPLPYNPAKIDLSQPGIWRYRNTFGLPDGAEAVSLGEGNTPLLWSEVNGRQVAFKCEYLNPTGSFKDRGSSVIAAFLKSRGIRDAVEDSSGNAGASFAAYSARAGIKARIFVPASASGPKRQQIETYGAELVPVHGSRSDVTKAVLVEANKGMTYASHAYLPFNLPGYATAAYEIFEQLGAAPSAIISPCGQGGLLLGVAKGFEAIRQSGNPIHLPKLIGVQSRACAPLWVMSTAGMAAMGFVTEGQTIAEGVKVRSPVRGDKILKIVKASQGQFVAVDEEDILRGHQELAQRGFYVEPTSAIVWYALEQVLESLPDPVVVLLTGSGYKSPIL
jgi:threonine synthase